MTFEFNIYNMDKRPNLYLVGAPKTGSTSLYSYLAEHPQIFMCADKEPHFFCSDLHEQCKELHGKLIKFRYTSEPEYQSLFQGVKDELVIGEASTSYLYSSLAAEKIHGFNPNAKIIVLLRNPIDLMNSWYHYIRYTSEEPVSTFEEALSLETARKSSLDNIPESVWYPARVYYRDLVQFDVQLQPYYKFFGQKNVKILIRSQRRI